MAGETTITLEGNLTADPELRFTPSGDAVANFTIASTPRTFDSQSKEWKDGDTLYLKAAAWRALGENIAESFVKGMGVIVTGKLKSRSFETKEGEKRTVIELEVENGGPSLKWAIAQVKKVNRQANGNNQGGGGGNRGGNQGGNQGGGGFGGGQQGNQQGGGFAGNQQGGQNQGGQQGGGQWGGQQDSSGWGNGPDSEPPF